VVLETASLSYPTPLNQHPARPS